MEDLSYFKNSRILDQREHKQKSPLISEGFLMLLILNII